MMNLNGSKQTNLTNHPSTDYSFTVLPLKILKTIINYACVDYNTIFPS